jgi:hypothetical protein
MNRHACALCSQHLQTFGAAVQCVGVHPQMRQVFPSHDFTRRRAPPSVSDVTLVCVVLTSGAMFGIAAQVALQHYGLDCGIIHSNLIADRVATSRSAAAWWAWWILPVAAFFVGPLSVAVTRNFVANRWLFRGLRLSASAAFVLGLASVGQLRPAPTTLGFAATAGIGLLVLVGATLLAGLGAYILGGSPRSRVPLRVPKPSRGLQPLRAFAFSPLPAVLPSRGGGSATSGVPFLGFRQAHALVPRSYSFARVAVAAVLAVVLLAGVSVLGGATVLLHSLAPGALRELVATKMPSAGTAGRARTMMLGLLPIDEERPRVIVAAAVIPVAPAIMVVFKPVEPQEPRQRAISASVGYRGPSLSEIELTFTKGYARRRAIQLAANMTSPLTIAQLTAAISINKVRPANLRLTRDRRVPRYVAESRYRASKHPRRNERYVDYNRRYADYGFYSAPHGRQERHRGRDYGDSRFARAGLWYGRF